MLRLKILILVHITFAALCLLSGFVHAQKLSALAQSPDWTQLDAFQNTITREAFLDLLKGVYESDGGVGSLIQIEEDQAKIVKVFGKPDVYVLKFGSGADLKPSPAYWKPASAREVAPPDLPLKNVTIALDPGHLGGKWAKMEERWYRIGDGKPVMEGDMVLYVARLLEKKLSIWGATVVYVRSQQSPVTTERPQTLRKGARTELRNRGVQDRDIRNAYTDPHSPTKQFSVQWMSELLFYRVSEIRTRAVKVNTDLKPDLAVCLHFNAEEWGDPNKPALIDKNHLHLLINGNYSYDELSYDDIRFDMIVKLLNQTYAEELRLSESLAITMKRAMDLPPYLYRGTGSGRKIGDNDYLYQRNLLANRLYHCPVVYLEPYVMNNQEVYERIQLGDYEGSKEVNGRNVKSIYREYADSVTEGILSYYKSNRPVPAPTSAPVSEPTPATIP